MGSSMSSETLETASGIRPETVTGSHRFTIFWYSLYQHIGIQSITSDAFAIGRFNWVIEYYPDGYTNKNKGYIAVYLKLKSIISSNVKVQFTFTILQQDGVPSNMSSTSEVITFNNTDHAMGFDRFAKRTDFEEANYLKDDAFTVKCTVIVFRGTKLQATDLCGVIVPPSNMNQHMVRLLESEEGADVTFVVNGVKFKAHRWMLAARSDVFKAEFSNGMKENQSDIITIEGIEAPIFRSMLYFIYSDTVPDFERGSFHGKGEKKDLSFMAQHLLVAADRYQLERLRLICEDVLCKNLVVGTVATTLILAERYNCSQLKAMCLKFMGFKI